MTRTYSDLIRLSTFDERFKYLCLYGKIGVSTFGFDRYINQMFYNSKEWRDIRHHIIVRDNACDLAIAGRDIFDSIRVHHMNPISIDTLEHNGKLAVDPEFLICTSLTTHNAIHFGDENNLTKLPEKRRKGDTTLWKAY